MDDILKYLKPVLLPKCISLCIRSVYVLL